MYLSKDFLKQRYLDERLSLAAIGREVRCAASHVRKMLIAHGLSLRSVSEGVRAGYPVPVGVRFGDLTIIREADGAINRKRLCICRCACGNEVSVPLATLRAGDRKSCGCAWRRAVGEMPGDYLYTLKFQAVKRRLKFSIDAPYIWELFLQQNRCCALSGLEISFNRQRHTASLDRIDSNFGYVRGNVQWLHKDVNRMKWDMPQAKFVELVKIIAQFCQPPVR